MSKRVAVVVALALPVVLVAVLAGEWVTFRLAGEDAARGVSGFSQAPGVGAVTAALAAAGFALAVMRGVLGRRIVAFVYVLLALLAAALCGVAGYLPDAAAASAVSKLTGLSGEQALYGVSYSATALPWCAAGVAVASAVWGVLCAVWVGSWAGSSRYAVGGVASAAAVAVERASAHRTDSEHRANSDAELGTVTGVRAAAEAGVAAAASSGIGKQLSDVGGEADTPDRIADWDALSQGDDPSADFR